MERNLNFMDWQHVKGSGYDDVYGFGDGYGSGYGDGYGYYFNKGKVRV
jgi:hypothetical protein